MTRRIGTHSGQTEDAVIPLDNSPVAPAQTPNRTPDAGAFRRRGRNVPTSDPQTRADFARDFVAALPACVEAVRRSAAARDTAALMSLLGDLKTRATESGLTAIERAAQQLEHTAQVNADLKDLEIAIQDLARLCRQVESGHGAS